MMVANLLDIWGAAMWRASWQGGLAALAVWLVCGLVPSIPARFQCWFWRLVMLKFVVALVWSIPVELPLLPATTAYVTASIGEETTSPTLADSLPASTAPLAPQQAAAFTTPWLLIPFLVWTAIAGWQVARIGMAFRSARRLRNGCRPSENRTLLAQLAQLSRSIGLAPPALLEMEGQGSPLLVGILRPAIVLPATTLSRLDANERTLVLGHELAHLSRRDLAWGVFATLVRALFSFHPLAWLSERQLGLAQEIAADELAIGLEQRDPVRYATQLVSVVSKLGPGPALPAMSVGMAGSHRSLKQRLSAMRFMKPVSRSTIVAYASLLGAVALLGIVPWALVAAEVSEAKPAPIKVPESKKPDLRAPETVPADRAEKIPATLAEKVPEKQAVKVAPKEKTERGRFVSFQNGVLKIQANSLALLENKIPDDAQVSVWDHEKNRYTPADNAGSILSRIEAGTWIIVSVASDNVTLRVGSKKGKTVGTFVSFKGSRLLILGTNLGETFTKKYGNNLHFNKFREDVPAYESVDGGEYQLIGEANKVLGNVQEGTILTIHGEGDDNITRVEIGVENKK